MEIELLKMLPGGGSVAALIVTVILFLKQQEKSQLNLGQVTETFNNRVAAAQSSFQDQIRQLIAHNAENQKLYQDQIQTLLDGHLEVSRETVVALRALETAVYELQSRSQPPTVRVAAAR
ncbi:hypothetical protein [Tautonia plasticadhaerens]|uniref:Uncharacterized protein n=1 Tax=Tautonia plasticadhaerens TaxID=2527974 RepID=A0A518H943_9BACT|nr:hypothetical protein [Tautonia plasticadhaerens]QDV37363.1 hypothetical protein ElP_53010 [Tautonia plasticadhaerens]